MKSHPILFKAEMVNAILAGRKTQTRRIITEEQAQAPQPYAKGDRLWVKETWATGPEHDGTKPTDLPDGCRIYYRADSHELRKDAGKWRPSIFMQERFSRVHLEVEHCHVECLNEISEEDAVREGIEQVPNCGPLRAFGWKNYDGRHVAFFSNPIASYRSLWDSIHGPKSWDENPLVRVITFKRIAP